MICQFDSFPGGVHVCRKCGASVSYSGYLPIKRICDTKTNDLPGTELKLLLARFGIVASPDCKCTSRAAYMDAKGCDWCESPEGMAEIMGFLREAAEERGLPFVDIAARLLVRRAISNARKAEAKRGRETDRPPLHAER